MNRKHLAVVLVFIPDWIGWRVGGLGSERHAKRKRCRLLCGSRHHGRKTGGRPGRRCGGEGRRGIVQCLACVGAVYRVVDRHGLAALKTAVLVKHGRGGG
jgi:hypothetical protein